jgi:hypothetical protein
MLEDTIHLEAPLHLHLEDTIDEWFAITANQEH